MSRLLLAVVLALPALAQTEVAPPRLDGRSFIPPEPRCEIWVDVAAMKANAVWDGLNRSAFAALLRMFESHIGFRIDALDRLRCYPVMEHAPDTNGAPTVIFEGDDTVVAPEGRTGTRLDKVGGLDAVVESEAWVAGDPDVWLSPRPGLVVFGASSRLEPMVTRRQQPGVLPPELLSLTAARGVLAHFVGQADESQQRMLGEMLAIKAPVTAPQFMVLRLRQVAGTDPDDPQVAAEALLRWQQDGKEPELMAAHLRGKIEELKKHRQFGALKRYWNRVNIAVDHRDVRLELLLGKPQEAGGMFAMLAPLMFLTTTVEVQAGQAAVLQDATEVSTETPAPVPAPAPAPAPVPAPAPAPTPAGGGQRGGG